MHNIGIIMVIFTNVANITHYCELLASSCPHVSTGPFSSFYSSLLTDEFLVGPENGKNAKQSVELLQNENAKVKTYSKTGNPEADMRDLFVGSRWLTPTQELQVWINMKRAAIKKTHFLRSFALQESKSFNENFNNSTEPQKRGASSIIRDDFRTSWASAMLVVYGKPTLESPLFRIDEATKDALLIDESTQLRTDLHQNHAELIERLNL